MSTTSDTAWGWVRDAQAGDRDAWARVYTAYRPFVRGYLARRVINPHTVEDLTSDTFTRALEALPHVRAQNVPVEAWLITIARNRLFDHTKAAHTRRSTPIPILPTDQVTKSNEEVVLHQHTTQRLGALLEEALAALPPRQAQVLRLRYIDEVPVADVARRLGVLVGAAKALGVRGTNDIRAAAATAPPHPDSDADRLDVAMHRLTHAVKVLTQRHRRPPTATRSAPPPTAEAVVA
jgi:RNA polymerase sigma-70 factor (ECF subfamily)